MSKTRAPKLPAPEAYLAQVCPIMAGLVATNPPFVPTRGDLDPYTALLRAVVYQQLSGKAAATIHGRVLALFDAPYPAPAALLALPDEALRGAGLSRQKTAALRDLAEKRLSGVVPDAAALESLEDADIIARLTSVRGVGRWTVEMYLIFTLGRPDVLPLNDLGIHRGVERALGKALSPKELAEFGQRWAPHRSAASWHLWRLSDQVAAAGKA